MTASLHIPTRVIFGEHSIDQLGDLARELNATRALVVTDPGVAAVGHAARGVESLSRAGVESVIFEGVHENPTTIDVNNAAAAARDAKVTMLVGLGGGSSIDTARGANFLLTYGGEMKDYRGFAKAPRDTAHGGPGEHAHDHAHPSAHGGKNVGGVGGWGGMLPLIAVPTTTGTGSEMQSYALIADPDTHQKMACGDHRARSAVAILDPHLARTQPRPVIACTGLDCIAHALETAVTRTRTPFSLMFSREAWRLASANFPRILADPADLDAMGAMLRAACFAGLAIEHSMLGAAHSAANPLTAQFNLTHGHAVGLMLPHVIRFNSTVPAARAAYVDLARSADHSLNGAADDAVIHALVDRVELAIAATGLPARLRDTGVTPDAIHALAASASTQWTARFNPRDVNEADFATLYHAGLGHPD